MNTNYIVLEFYPNSLPECFSTVFVSKLKLYLHSVHFETNGWFEEKCRHTLRFFEIPLNFLLSRGLLTITQPQPTALEAYSLGLHFECAQVLGWHQLMSLYVLYQWGHAVHHQACCLPVRAAQYSSSSVARFRQLPKTHVCPISLSPAWPVQVIFLNILAALRAFLPSFQSFQTQNRAPLLSTFFEHLPFLSTFLLSLSRPVPLKHFITCACALCSNKNIFAFSLTMCVPGLKFSVKHHFHTSLANH